jgi:Tfp pilus assembly major pilin PilA
MKKFAYALLTMMASVLFTSCNSEDKLDTNTLLYQDYYVETENGVTTAFANFREGNSEGSRVKLNNGASITANGNAMTYVNGNQVSGTYDYYTVINDEVSQVDFTLKRNASTTLSNTLYFSIVPEFIVANDDMKTVTNGVRYTVNKTTAGNSLAKLKVALVNSSNVSYTAVTGPNDAYYIFTGVPAGTYKLFVAFYATTSVAQSNGSAGGMMTYYRISSYENVKVE